MTTIQYKEFEGYVKNIGAGKQAPAPSVVLFFGEESLYKAALETLLDALMSPAQRKFQYQTFEGSRENITEAVGQMNTYSLLGGRKVVALLESDLFHSRQDDGKLLAAAKEAYDQDRKPKAAHYFSSLLRLLNLEAATFDSDARKAILTIGAGIVPDGSWIDDLVSTCREFPERDGSSSDGLEILEAALEHGFPPEHCLVITSEIADKRRRLYKIIHDVGVVVDCSVPRSERQADKAAQEAVLALKKEEILAGAGKKIGGPAYARLCGLTGFDIRTFVDNLNKLVDYTGQREEITESDVSTVVKRTKQDPIYEFTNAVTDKNLDDALFFLHSLLTDGSHPLQILTALTNQTRKLLVTKTFCEKLPRRQWHANVSYQQFQQAVLPLAVDRDQAFMRSLEEWDADSAQGREGRTEKGSRQKVKPKKGKPRTDLLIAPNPRNPYPIFKTMQKAERFTKNELLGMMQILSGADASLKRSGRAPISVLEGIVIKICQGE